MEVVDFGRFQTGHKCLMEAILKVKSGSFFKGNFLIIGEIGTGRRSLAEIIFESMAKSNDSLSRYGVTATNSNYILVENFDRKSIGEQISIVSQVERQTEKVWFLTVGKSFINEVEKGLVPRKILDLVPNQFEVPSLVERKNDLPHLIKNFLSVYSWMNGQIYRITDEALDIMANLKFKENIAELERLLERCIYETKSGTIEKDLVLKYQAELGFETKVVPLVEMERKLILQTLELTQNNKTQASRLLGISIRTLRNKLSQYRKEGLYESVI